MSLIALEEHFAWHPASADNVVATWLRSNNEVGYQRLYDRGPLRLEQMDAAASTSRSCRCSTRECRRTPTSRTPSTSPVAETVRGNPHRFGGFATLATQDPDAAAAELERAVTELGLVGALINGALRK
jgi:predicted TIM-barrel fold metal-dependent hydrolase